MENRIEYLAAADGERLACRHRDGDGPGVFFLGGFNSSMAGNKATAIDGWCRLGGRAFTRFDYRGHGASGGELAEGTIGGWLDDACRVLDTLTTGRQVFVGSSLGGWLALLLARVRPQRCAALLLLAPAADFTERLLPRQLGPAALAELERGGVCELPSDYPGDRPYRIGRQLLTEGREHCILNGPRLAVGAPLRIIHGMDDASVPWRESLALVDAVDGDVEVTLVKGGDHRLSTPADSARMLRQLAVLCDDQRPTAV